jgi:hypothetical protein
MVMVASKDKFLFIKKVGTHTFRQIEQSSTAP